MTPRPALLATLLAVACAGPKESWSDLSTPEVLVEVLPRGAILEVDGRPLGPGSRTVPVPDRSRRYVFRATAPGFEAAEAASQGAKLAGARLSLVLRPGGFGSARRLDFDEPAGLAQAAAVLLGAGRLEDARDYAARALAVGEVPLAHRVLGAVYDQQGNRRLAAQHYSLYLSLFPDAPDAAAVAAAAAEARGDLSVPAPRDGPPDAPPAR